MTRDRRKNLSLLSITKDIKSRIRSNIRRSGYFSFHYSIQLILWKSSWSPEKLDDLLRRVFLNLICPQMALLLPSETKSWFKSLRWIHWMLFSLCPELDLQIEDIQRDSLFRPGIETDEKVKELSEFHTHPHERKRKGSCIRFPLVSDRDA